MLLKNASKFWCQQLKSLPLLIQNLHGHQYYNILSVFIRMVFVDINFPILICIILLNYIVKFTFYCLDHVKKVLNSSDLKLFSGKQSLMNSHRGTVDCFINHIMGKARSRYY